MRKVLKKLLFKLSRIAITLGFLFAIACILLRLGPVNEMILSIIKQQVEDTTGWRLNAMAMDRVSPFAMRLRGVELISPDGTRIDAKRLSLTFAPYHLFLGRVVFPSVSIRDVSIVKEEDSISSSTHDLPVVSGVLAPLGIEVQHFKMTNLQVDDQATSAWLPADVTLPTSLNVAGQLRMNTIFRTAVADISLEDGQNPGHQTICIISAHQLGNDVRVDLRIAEDQYGLLHSSLGSMTPYSVELSAHSLLHWPQAPHSWQEAIYDCSASGQFFFFCTQGDEEEGDVAPIGPLGESASVAGDFQWLAAQGLKIDELVVESHFNNATIKASGGLNLDPLLELRNARFHLSIDNSAILNEFVGITSEGSIEASGALEGPWRHPGINFNLKTFDLAINNHHVGNVQIQGQGRCSANALSGTAALSCSFGPINTHSTFALTWDYGNQVKLQDLHWQAPMATLRGNLDFSLATFLVDGHLDGEAGNLGWLLPTVVEPIRGTGSISLNLHSHEGQGPQVIDLIAEADHLGVKDLWSDHIRIEAHLNDLPDRAHGNVKILAKDLRLTTGHLKDISLELAIPVNEAPWGYHLQANGRWESKFRIIANGEVTPSLEMPVLTVNQLTGRLRGHPLQLGDPFTTSWSLSSIDVSPIALKVGEGNLRLRGSYHLGQDAHLSAKASHLPMELIHLLVPQMPMQGYFSGALEAHGPPDDPKATLRLEADQIVVADSGLLNIPPLHARANGVVENGLLQATGDIIGIGEQPVAATATLPIRLSLVPFEIRLLPDQPLTATITANGEVSPLMQLLVSDTTSVTGQARVALDISGTYQAPLLNGTLDLRDCTYEGLDTGCMMRNIQAKLEGRGNELVLTHLSAADGRRGTVTGSGVIRLDPSKKYPYNIALNINQTLILRRDYIQGIASGQLNLLGDSEHSVLRGKLVADGLTVTIPKQMPTPAASLDITFINSPKPKNAPMSLADSKKSNPLVLDITIDIPSGGYLRSEELRSEWRGTINVAGTSEAPLYFGELRVARGDYLMNGKPFHLDKGTISFSGDLEKRTNLYIVASQDIDRYSIEAVLKGPMRAPDLSLRSNPHLSQREILSWLIFGRGLNDVTPLEHDQAGQAVVDLSKTDQSNMASMMSRLKRLGIDRLDFNNDDPEFHDMSVQIGKYLCPDIFISLNRGLTTDSNRFSVEANVIKHVKLQAEVDDEATGGMRLMWKHDY